MLVKVLFEQRKLQNFFLILFVTTVSECSSLRLTNMTAPAIQDPRKDMELYCEFDMGDEELYAVKWYKDDHEFFRFSPSGNQRLIQFQVIGVNVDLKRTKCTMTSCKILLNELSRIYSSGAYRCEVSTEAPTFRLASQTHNITIAVIPPQNPFIDGINDQYLVGDILKAVCSSGLGDPKPTLEWYINRQSVNNKYLKELPPKQDSYDLTTDKVKLRSATVQIMLPIEKKYTENKGINVIEIGCVQYSENQHGLIAPSKSTTKIVRITTKEQLINNQKLYGVFGTATTFSYSYQFFVWVFMVNYIK